MSLITVKATLRTRCGCWQHQDVPFPPPPLVLLKLKPKPLTSNQVGTIQPAQLEYRRFRLQDFDKTFADYEESEL